MQKKFTTKIIIIAIIALVAPLISYTIFQLAERNENEDLIQSIYSQQLNSILFSVNQHCWDVFNSCTAEVKSLYSTKKTPKSYFDLKKNAQKLFKKHPSVIGLFFQNEKKNDFLLFNKHNTNSRISRLNELSKVKKLIINSRVDINKMIDHAEGGYIRPFICGWELGHNREISLLLFSLIEKTKINQTPVLAGLFIDNISFVNNIIARKFDEMDDGSFIFGVRQPGSHEIIYSNSESQNIQFERNEKLWILPSLELLIKIRGTTLEQVSKALTQRNIIFIILVNVILLTGMFYLIRSIFKEMKLAQMKTDFVANVSHELRTPLALIRMQAETLEMGRIRTAEKKRHYYRTIMNESLRLTQLINNILDFSRIESNKKEYNFKSADLTDTVLQTLEMYHFHFEQKGFKLEKKIAKNIPTVELDEQSIKLALVNLLDNAIKFSAHEKRVVVSLEKKADKLELSVQDFGIGIDESEQKKVFEKFYRVGSSLVHNTKGSGLGLSLVANIMAIHHGKVLLKSKLGKGSTFSLLFPVS